MLNEKLESRIKEVDILTDFDGTMIKNESQYLQVYAYLVYSIGNNHSNLIKKVMKGHINYKKNKDVSVFYSVLKGCPTDILDNIVSRCKQNEKWNTLLTKLNPKKVGIVSRNNGRFILKYLDMQKNQSWEINITAANKPEIENDIYTGEVEVIVNNNNLIDFIRKKDYICGKDEIKILEKFGVYSKKTDTGLYICSNKKIF
jgi:phosphoserine phosphatase